MLFQLPDTATLYQALTARDPRYEGQVYVCVTSTGIFCRLTCPARKPKPENCVFAESISACITDGYRPCKRCRPLDPQDHDPDVTRLLEALERAPERRWSERDVAAMGLDPSTIRRRFKRLYGLTFLDMARQRRLRAGFTALGQGDRVIEAQVEAGFESASAFRAAFARLLGRPPASFKLEGQLLADWIPTPLGDMIAVSSHTELHLLEFVGRKALRAELCRLDAAVGGDLGIGTTPVGETLRAELTAYFSGASARFRTPLARHGTPFQREVWAALREIPAGESRSYAQIARAIGRPSATRAVARANGANQIALLIPCHRVIGADGALTGYGGGLWRKQRLLEIERHYAAAEPPAQARPSVNSTRSQRLP
ncbi:bifunctional transcriptional activator/DNA repair enzyme AdaA [Poseidonocella sedimentorum]|uniref:methylated-DNA--[protein]-cysteine S-methyltransferase n=1 Tax=Poseidonocella sedimentorum TaxID=871652 RepID=A0A1I6DYA6_9RHOB|nr:trifunctional transcriptional activator/DNA repair protein Ada/methylated-DNA--[protein]-cysteine S-methyltransferase [Poseidonocella sedimentorum]SFR10268.1 DNA-O6-methylguanine--protein-cysteine S-methyltransferase /Transcriptional regulator Ada [Poseidonocella sedimentorum]